MDYAYRYRAYPPQAIVEELLRHLNIHRQAYNNTRYEYNHLDNDTHDVGSAYQHQQRLPEWKDKWPIFEEVHSKALQKTVERFYNNLSNLSDRKQQGYNVGELRWKPPKEYQSITYSQSGFELKNTSGHDDGTATLWLSKIGDIPIRYHRPIPDNASINEVTIKQEKTGEWFVSFAVTVPDADLPEKPDVDELKQDDVVGVDLGVLNYIHTSDGVAVEGLDLESEYERLRKAQRTLSRREHGSNNWEKQRRRVAAAKRRIRRKVLDYQHKLSTWLCNEYDAVFVEDLDVKPMLEAEGNARNKQDAAWNRFLRLLEYKADLYGCHVERVDPADTTKECSQCGVASDKPLWVREHSCPSCGFVLDRDWNAALNVLERGLAALGLGQSERDELIARGTPAETSAPAGASAEDGSVDVLASTVVETGTPLYESRGSPTLKEPAVAGE